METPSPWRPAYQGRNRANERNRHRFTRTVEGVSCDLCGRYVKGIHLTEMSWIQAERGRCRRPIAADEVVGLEALGGELRRLRREVAGISRARLGVLAEVSSRQLEQIERGIRRTRRSTLERIAEALVQIRPDLGEPAALAVWLVALARNGLAPESEYRERVDKRRKARNAKLRRRVMYRYIIPMFHARLDAELRAERRAGLK